MHIRLRKGEIMKFGSRQLILGATSMLIVCLLSIGLVNGQAAQQPRPQMAEDVFKNIPVIKGIPVDEFMDTMGMFSNALAMNCTDCHTADSTSEWVNFAKDTPLKIRARQMSLMVQGINKNNFGGQRKVTCYTCHHGEQKPKANAGLTQQYSAPIEDPNEVVIPPKGYPNAPTADAVFNKYIEAVGGAQRAGAITSIVAKGNYKGYDTDHGTVPVDIVVKAPNQRSHIVHALFGDKVTVTDGRMGWFSSPDKPAPLIQLTGGNLDGAKVDSMVWFPTQVRNMATNWRVGSTAIEDKDVQVVQGTLNGQNFNLYFDEETGLLLRMTRFADSLMGGVPTQLDFSNYKEVNGVKIPHTIVTTWTDNQTFTELTSVQANAPVDAAKFNRPAPAPPPKLQ
jgi:photosynthetic reaction center cytochrome c subunit